LAVAQRQEFHSLHQSVMSKIDSQDSRVVQFISSQFGEGVTTVALGYAAFLATVVGKNQVVVVEANFRQPSFREMFGLHLEYGLHSAIEERVELEEAVVCLDGPGFCILACDKVHDQTMLLPMDSGLYAVQRSIKDVLCKLRERFRFVLIDSAPAVPFMDGCVLAPAADGVVYVIESNRTRAEVVNRGLDKLKSCGGNVLGMVLNKRVFHIPQFLYRLL
ncbi:MAG: CpsD/CapB family tyrosine-protein kinase, partial [Desulfomonile sp.]|nr:CpsD/CapB family tyrosine-protein kinase [Desulfomonile sp.]